ncbi:hypothetical protein JZ751_003096 [Albula glossodonta]|uniref:Uncharacterized protein n=1 Tax=Albula glossodonta TaxID=121402 RepID=A0A8T2NGF7_9TELE|nr:hypothetical protein JZ751_003096 [Albula glossodonta]
MRCSAGGFFLWELRLSREPEPPLPARDAAQLRCSTVGLFLSLPPRHSQLNIHPLNITISVTRREAVTEAQSGTLSGAAAIYRKQSDVGMAGAHWSKDTGVTGVTLRHSASGGAKRRAAEALILLFVHARVHGTRSVPSTGDETAVVGEPSFLSCPCALLHAAAPCLPTLVLTSRTSDLRSRILSLRR